MRLLIKYPTRGRPENFFEALQNIEDTISTNDYSVLVTADVNDPSMNNFEVLAKVLHAYQNVFIAYDTQVSKVDAINRRMDVAEKMKWDWSVVMSDDQKFMVEGWDCEMLNLIKRIWGDSTDFFAHFSDNYTCEKLPTLNVCGREYYDRDGFFYHPSYGSVSCDAENMWVAMMRGKYHYFPEVFFHHVHPGNIATLPTDETYRGNDKFGDADTRNYFERMKHYFYVENPVMIPEQLQKEINSLT